jgi:hypothetical protein
MDKDNTTDATRRNRTQPRRPPYARRIEERRRAGASPLDATVLTGAESWALARLIGAADASLNAIIVLPPMDEPERYEWTWARGLRCRIVQTSPCLAEHMERLAVLLVQAGSPLVELLTPAGDDADLYLPREAP